MNLIFDRKWIPGCGVELIINSNKGTISNNLPQQNIKILPKYSVPCKELNSNEIIHNLNIFTEFGELSPNQVLTLFDKFINFPDFQHSNFLSSMEQNLSKYSHEELAENESEATIEEKEDTK